MKKFRIYDNGGKSFDRYTFVIRENDSNVLHFWGSSENPHHPQGFGMYCGASSEGYQAGAHLGAKIKAFDSLPIDAAAFFVECVRNCGWDFHESQAAFNLT